MSPREDSRSALARRLRRRWTVLEVAATVVGALVVLSFLHAFHTAEDPAHTGHDALTGGARLIAFFAVALPLGCLWRVRRTHALWAWLSADHPASIRERDRILREPLRALVVPATLWAIATIVFTAEGALHSARRALEMGLTTALAGVTTCALIYLLIERLLRPVTARALEGRPPEELVGVGVRVRLVTAWALSSGVPLFGLAFLAVTALGGSFEDTAAFAAAVLLLAGAGLGAGAMATVLSARSLAEPIGSVRKALAQVHDGDYDAHVAVDDGSEVGLLQAGFNEMAAGLRERERLRDLFGRHVGEDVARRALDRGVALGGEVREIAALFVDLVGSTTLASRRPPEEVVALLNRFFAVVVDVVEAHGGLINKFEGDAALCIFGAPGVHPDPAGRALAAGRELAQRLRRDLPELAAGVGISAGRAVAGNVGTEHRLEYTVIGDPVNEGARLCELAKDDPARVLASDSAVRRATPPEAARWRIETETILRGRTAVTRIARPVGDLASEATRRPVVSGR